MAQFDTFHIRLAGFSDEGTVAGRVTMGFWDEDITERALLKIPIRIDATTESTMREMREQARLSAIVLLEDALESLRLGDAETVHEAAVVNFNEMMQRSEIQAQAELQEQLSETKT